MSFSKQRSLTSGRDLGDGEAVVGIVKDVDKSPNMKERKVRVKMEGSKRPEESIYVPTKYAKDLKPTHTYAFHLEEQSFRGSGESMFRGSSMIRRTKVAPHEIHNSGFGGSSRGGGSRFGRSW